MENGTATISIYNTLGVLVSEQPFVVTNNRLSANIATANMPEGNYIICIKNNANVINLSAVVTH